MKKIEEIENDVIEYFAVGRTKEIEKKYSEEQIEIMAIASMEWDKLPCDAEGANEEQMKEQNSLIEKTAREVEACQ